MTNVNRYFRFHLKERLRTLIFIFFVVVIVTFLIGTTLQPTEQYDSATKTWIPDYSCTLWLPVLFLCVLAYTLPEAEFSFFKKRINLDCAYSLPISRRAMGIVHYLTGLITLFSAFSLSYLLNFALLLHHGSEWFCFPPLIAHYFLCLLLGFCLYSLMVFVFNEGNTRGDGIWFIFLYSFAFLLAFVAILSILDAWKFDEYIALPWAMIDLITSNYQHLVEIDQASKFVFWQTPEYVVGFVFWVAIGFASAIGFVLSFGKKRMEATEELSNSFFGFRVLIPIYTASVMIFTDANVVGWIFIELFALFGYAIYRRGFRYQKSDIITLALLSLLLFA